MAAVAPTANLISRPHQNSESPSAASHRGPWWAVILATGLGVGYGPVMPGTYGSVLGVGLYLALAHQVRLFHEPRLVLALAAVLLTALSILVVAVALKGFTAKDPQEIVLDEVAGQFVTLVPLPLIPAGAWSYWTAIVAGFILFRALDAAKPYPIWKLERLHGAWGIVADDIGAGLVGALMLWGAMALGWKI